MDTSELHFLDKYAINNSRQVYEHRVPQEHTKGTVLHVRSFHASATQVRLHEDPEDNGPPVPTAAETAPIKPAKTTDCVWVGMVLSAEKLASIKQEEEAGPASPSMNNIPAADDPAGEARAARPRAKAGRNLDLVGECKVDDIITFDPKAKRVIVKKLKGYSFWALNRPDHQTGLSTGYKVNHDQIYFFKDFRDDEKTSQRERWVASAMKAQQACDRIGGISAGPLSAIHEAPRTENDQPDNKFRISIKQTGRHEDPSPRFELGQHAENLLAAEDYLGYGIDEIVNMNTDLQLRADPDLHADMDQQLQESINHGTSGERPHVTRSEVSSKRSSDIPAVSSDVIEIRDTSSDDDPKTKDLRAYSPLTDHGDEVGLGINGITSESLDGDKGQVEGGGVSLNGSSKQAMPIREKAKATANHSQTRKRHRATEDDGYTSGDDNYQQEYTDKVAKPLKALIDKMQKRGQGALLHQLHTLAKCLDREEEPAPGSALMVSLNIPDKLHGKDCSRMLTELYSIFPYLKADTEGMSPKTLAWMLKGLRLTGSSISLPLIRAYLVAFTLEVRGEIGDKVPGRREFTIDRLVDMICAARDHAEAIVCHADGGSSSSAAENGEAFPHADENGEVWAHMPWTDTRT